jgi:hypothetical protein
MSHARSGELSVELGRQEPNANKACRKNGNVLDRPRQAVEPATRHASSARPHCVWLAPGPWQSLDKTSRMDSRDRCPRVEPS